jgi:hypothetical protein
MNITGRLKILLAVAGLLALAAGARYLYQPLMANERGLREEIELKAALLGRYRRAVEEKRDWEERTRFAGEALEKTAPQLFSAKTRALAAARLQSFIEKKAEENGVKIKSVRTGKAEKLDTFTRVEVRVVFASGIRGLVNLLYDLNSSPKLMNVSEVTMKGGAEFTSTLTFEALAHVADEDEPG